MIKVSFFIRRNPSWSAEAFHDHWRNNHAALIKKHAAVFGIGRYVQTHAIAHPRNEPSEAFPEPCDGVAELWFRTREQLDLWFDNTTPEAQAAGKEIRADERRFIDRARSPFVIGEELEIIAQG
jgi:uncharacterized protein (TIGR02118 family)